MNKNILQIAITVLLLSVLLACSIGPLTIDLGGGGDNAGADNGENADASIEAGINAPAQGANLPAGPTEIAYYATSLNGVASIELSVDGEVLSTVASPDTSEQVVALKYTWDPAVPGSHTIRVRALDSKGAWSEYAVVTVNIESSQEDEASSGQAQTEETTATDTPSPTATPDEMTIYNVEHDKNLFYWGSGSCGSKEITIEADVTHPDDAYAAIIFFRFWDKEGTGLSAWSSGNAMARDSDEHFRITISSENIPNYSNYDFAVLYYQIKVQSKPPNPEILAGTEVIKQIEMQRCP